MNYLIASYAVALGSILLYRAYIAREKAILKRSMASFKTASPQESKAG
ncbi:MAG: hypothetical protein JRC77_08025 [Deltaproteobacteria bacterium]|nr:hypothetical protein [Deltaproteobacteria bacterium]